MTDTGTSNNESEHDGFMDSVLSDPIESFAISLVLEYLQKRGWNRALEGMQKDLKQVRLIDVYYYR